MLRPALVIAAIVLLALPAAASAGGKNGVYLGDQTVMGVTLHPSGNDRTVENGGSGTQGWAQHDPDADYNYGVDQNGADGGVYTGDQDGNNGCGNDQDFEDDNNGNCGGGRDRCVETTTIVVGANGHYNTKKTTVCDEPECEFSCETGGDTSDPNATEDDSWFSGLIFWI
jgi:hypothetical protein